MSCHQGLDLRMVSLLGTISVSSAGMSSQYDLELVQDSRMLTFTDMHMLGEMAA